MTGKAPIVWHVEQREIDSALRNAPGYQTRYRMTFHHNPPNPGQQVGFSILDCALNLAIDWAVDIRTAFERSEKAASSEYPQHREFAARQWAIRRAYNEGTRALRRKGL